MGLTNRGSGLWLPRCKIKPGEVFSCYGKKCNISLTEGLTAPRAWSLGAWNTLAPVLCGHRLKTLSCFIREWTLSEWTLSSALWMWLLIKDVERRKSSLLENKGNMELEIFINLEIKIFMEINAKLFLFPLAGLVLTTGVQHVVGRKGTQLLKL